MPGNLYEIASTTAKDIQIARMRVSPEILLDLQRQRVHAAPHVRHTSRQPHPNSARNRDRRRARTARTRASAEPSTSRSTVTRTPPGNAISIRPTARRSADHHRHEPAVPHIARQLPELPPPGEQLVRVQVVAPRHNRYGYPGLIALGHDPTLLRIAPEATSGRRAFLPADRLLRFIQHPRSCPSNRLMDTKMATIHDRSLSRNLTKPDRRPSAEAYGLRHNLVLLVVRPNARVRYDTATPSDSGHLRHTRNRERLRGGQPTHVVKDARRLPRRPKVSSYIRMVVSYVGVIIGPEREGP